MLGIPQKEKAISRRGRCGVPTPGVPGGAAPLGWTRAARVVCWATYRAAKPVRSDRRKGGLNATPQGESCRDKQMRDPLRICSTSRMARIIVAAALSLLLRANLTLHSAGSPRFTPNVSDATVWSLVWSDEFNGPNGSGVDTAKWVPETGGSGWGNNELEYYTDRLQNADIENGSLAIKALKETYTGPDNVTRNYTSARLKTQTKFSLSYGRIEARLKVTYGQGMWPAFWMLGTNIDQVGWPTCGEIDIMENIGREPSVVHGTIHGPGYSGGNGLEASYSLSNGKHFADAFHTFAIEWEPNVVCFYVDGLLYKTRTPADLPTSAKWVFDHPFFILLNIAVGGFWPGVPDASTIFPQTMLVDYVRVYQRSTPSSSVAGQFGLDCNSQAFGIPKGSNLVAVGELCDAHGSRINILLDPERVKRSVQM